MMKDYEALSEDALELIAARFRVLGEPMRLRLLQELTEKELTVTELVGRTGATQANVSKHLSLLVQAGLVYKRREGVNIYCGIADVSVFKLCSIVCGGLQKQFLNHARVIGR